MNTIASYPTEVQLTVEHREGLLGEDLLAAMQREIIPGNTASPAPRMSLDRDTTELVIPNLEMTTRTKAQDAATRICRELNLTPSARPAKWLTKHHNREGYQNKPTTPRFAVHTESLRRLNSTLPLNLPGTNAKIFIYRRNDDKAYYMDEAGYTVTAPRPSTSPEPIKQWTFCTYCNRANHEEKECFSKTRDMERSRRETTRTNV